MKKKHPTKTELRSKLDQLFACCDLAESIGEIVKVKRDLDTMLDHYILNSQEEKTES